MKNATTKLLSSAVTLFALSNTCLAENTFINNEVVPYVRLDSGWAVFEKVTGYSFGEGQSTKLKSSNTPVVGAGVGLGINFGDKFRTDITWSHHINPKLKAARSYGRVKCKPVIDAYFLNIYYELGNLVSIFNPYIGIGAGVATIKDNLIIASRKNNILGTSDLISRKNNFAYRLIIGSAFDLNKNVKFDIAYNYNDYGKTKSKINKSSNQVGKTHYKAHIISAGLRFGM